MAPHRLHYVLVARQRNYALGALVVSIIGLIVTIAGFAIAVFTYQADRQRDFEAKQSVCLDSIRAERDLAADLFGIREPVVDQRIADTVLNTQIRFYNACVETGMIAASSELVEETYFTGTQMALLLLGPVGEFEPDELVKDWRHLLNEAEDYVLALPDVPIAPWQDRSAPDAIHAPRAE